MQTTGGGTQLIDAKDLLKNQLDLRPGQVYADLGVGSSGHFTFSAADIVGPEGMVYSIDIIQGILTAIDSRARSAGFNNIKTAWSDLEVYGAAKDIANETADRINIANLLFQTKQDEHVFNEANRMLKPGGKAMVIDWLPTGATFGPPEDERTSLDKVRQMAKVVGWKEIGTFDASDYHFGVVFQK